MAMEASLLSPEGTNPTLEKHADHHMRKLSAGGSDLGDAFAYLVCTYIEE